MSKRDCSSPWCFFCSFLLVRRGSLSWLKLEARGEDGPMVGIGARSERHGYVDVDVRRESFSGERSSIMCRILCVIKVAEILIEHRGSVKLEPEEKL